MDNNSSVTSPDKDNTISSDRASEVCLFFLFCFLMMKLDLGAVNHLVYLIPMSELARQLGKHKTTLKDIDTNS